MVKFGTKLVNKTHRVRVEDLIKVTNNNERRPTRTSATKAAEKIKSLIPILKRIESAISTTHTWNYEDVLDMVMRGDDEFVVTRNGEEIDHNHENNDAEDNDSEDNDSEATETRETSESSEGNEVFLDSHDDNVVDSTNQTNSTDSNELLNPNLVRNMNSFLANPSIATHPLHHSQVNLNTVQNLGAVLETVYNSNNGPAENRRSERTAAKAKTDYLAMHRGK